MQKNIYVVLSCTNTFLGKLIRFFSNYNFNHISLSSTSYLQPLYSFARYNYNSPIVGGFVEESIHRYLFYKKNTKIRIYKIEVDEKTFEKFQLIMKRYSDNNSEYIYDTFGIFHGSSLSNQYHQTCLSFSVYVLKELSLLSSNIHIKNIKEFEKILSSFPYTDTQFLYKENDSYVWGNDNYYQKIPCFKVIKDTFFHLKKA